MTAPRYGVSRADLENLLEAWGEPRYRADQVWKGLYEQRQPLDEVSTLPKALRKRLVDTVPLALTVRADQTGDAGMTRKWLWEGADGAQVETVLMRYPDRATVCVSSQAGCAMACSFCATGQAGFERHLTTGEIVEQVVRAQHASPQRVSNVVFMGMGEPLANLEGVWPAVERLHDDLGLSARNITVSTVGVVPGMRRLVLERLPVTLAVSIHAPDDDLRSRLVPLNRRYPLDEVLAAAREYMNVKGRRVTFEYVMLEGVNDAEEQADALGALLVGARFGVSAHVNLIPYNTTPGFDARASHGERIRRFARRLERPGVTVTIRRNRGVDIDAACGQLRFREVSARQ
ncbi:MAG TPA: 23S rRNA (adenine(2503)-C(2))-methyltransferase RlmN [Acidimicrobiia bacterium]|nr:23S rRNA (adenine(2503)-C(2))-methyltransferase RlmN [Acidimicrobiia bacterium]